MRMRLIEPAGRIRPRRDSTAEMELENGTRRCQTCEPARFLNNSTHCRRLGKENHVLEEVVGFAKEFAQKEASERVGVLERDGEIANKYGPFSSNWQNRSSLGFGEFFRPFSSSCRFLRFLFPMALDAANFQ